MRLLLLSLAALIGLSSPALATGGFACAIDDDNLRFTAEAGFSYSPGSGLLNFRGTLQLAEALAPKGLETRDLTPADLPHDWLHDGELRLMIHVETAGDLPFASVDLVVMTKVGEDETTYDGDYTLSVYTAEQGEKTERTGRVSCSLG